MTASLVSKLTVGLKATLKNPLDLSTPEDVVNLVKSIALPDGTGTGAARKMHHDQLSLSESSEGSLDLSGSLEDALGQAFVLTKVQALVLVASENNPGNVVVLAGDAAGVNSFGDYIQVTEAADKGIVLQPGGVFALGSPGAGYDVTATTADKLVWRSAATTGTYKLDVYVIGK